ncbi:MAG: hypothetical protein LBI82_00865 [Dysgonamonadaceae bacterium]|jgi:hypothetical protein|nr:hypothetical protein [Dysgonamonadaceae bacterium]
MKTLKIFILAVSLLVSGQIHANMKEYSESWLQKDPSPSGFIPPATDPTTPEPTVADSPVHDGVYVLLALAGAYILVRNRKKTIAKD